MSTIIFIYLFIDDLLTIIPSYLVKFRPPVKEECLDLLQEIYAESK